VGQPDAARTTASKAAWALAFHFAGNALVVVAGWVDMTPYSGSRPGRSTL
jgi:hypothetical protein